MGVMEKSGCDAVVMFPVQYVVSRIATHRGVGDPHSHSDGVGAGRIRRGRQSHVVWPQLARLHDAPRVLRRPHRQGHQACGIPVELPTRVEFVLNQKAAKALGITIPRAVELRADRVLT